MSAAAAAPGHEGRGGGGGEESWGPEAVEREKVTELGWGRGAARWRERHYEGRGGGSEAWGN